MAQTKQTEVILGTDLMFFVGEENKPFAFATGCSLSVSCDTRETSNKDLGKWKSYAAGKLSYSLSTSSLLAMEDYKKVMDMMIERKPLKFVFTLAQNANADTGAPEGGWLPATEGGYKGEIILTSVNATANDNENATLEINGEGCAPLEAHTAVSA